MCIIIVQGELKGVCDETFGEALYHKVQLLLENGGRSLLSVRACRCHS